MSVYIVAHVENSGVTTAQPQQNGRRPLRWQPSQSKKQLQQASFLECCQWLHPGRLIIMEDHVSFLNWWFVYSMLIFEGVVVFVCRRWETVTLIAPLGTIFCGRPQEDVFWAETQKQSGPLTGISMVLTSLVGVLTGLPFTRPLVGVISFNLKLQLHS